MMMSPKLDVAVPEVLEMLAAIELHRHHGFSFWVGGPAKNRGKLKREPTPERFLISL
jgi:hypothetical protein